LRTALPRLDKPRARRHFFLRMAKADPAPRLSKKAYEARVPDLRAALVHMQVQLKNAPFPVLVVVAGVDAAGKGDVVNVLNAWLDPRGVETFAFHEPTDEERERPAMWRFWRCLPPHGRMAIYAGGWHTEALRDDPRSPRDLAEFDLALRRIARFEDQLTADGALMRTWPESSASARCQRGLRPAMLGC
jgi:polyphosphate kinase 2 (PPK2 family)